MAKPSPHNVLLLQISGDLTQSDLDSLLFCCGDVISECAARKIRKGTDLFTALMHRTLLAPGQYSYLRDCLEAIDRVDLARKLPSELESVLSQVSHQKSLVHGTKQTRLPAAAPYHTQRDSSLSSTVSSRAQFLQIAERLSSEDVSKLAYLCPGRPSCEDLGEMSAVSVMLRLESAEVIDPSRPETLANLLQCIERRDLILSMRNPHSSQCFGLDQPHQLLNLKMSMFANQHSHYAFQRRVMGTIASSDGIVVEEQIVKPVNARLLQSYEFSTVHQLCTAAFLKCNDFDGIIQSTLSIMSDFFDAYIDLFYHYVYCDEGILIIATLEPLFRKCQDCYNRFEEQISQFPWNGTLRENVQRDMAQRRTPFGSPAYNAMTCISDICGELTGRVKVKSIMKDVDRNLYALECLFYGYSFRVVMSQWLKSILCLLVKNDVSDCSISYNPDILRATLLQIVTKHRDRISCCYNELVAVFGESVMKRISSELLKEGIDIEAGCLSRTLLSGSDSGMYVTNVHTQIFMDLFSLLRLSYFGGKDLNFGGVLSNMKDFHLGMMTSSYFIPCTVRLYQNLIQAYEVQIDNFRDQMLKSNSLCAPVLRQLISL